MEEAEPNHTQSRLWVGAFLIATFGTGTLLKTGTIPGWRGLVLFAASFLLLIPMIRSIERAAAQTGCMTVAMHRYNRRMMIASFAYVALLLGCGEFARYYAPPIAVRVVLAIAVSLPVILMVRAAALMLTEETDEFRRLLHVRQFLTATGVLLTAATLYGFLNAFDVAPRLDAWVAVPLWGVGVAIGALVNRFTSGSPGAC